MRSAAYDRNFYRKNFRRNRNMLTKNTFVSDIPNRLKQNKLAKAIIGASLVITFSFSVTAQAENLIEVYNLSYLSDPVLKQVISQRQSVGEGSVQAFAAFLPQVNASASSFGNNKDNPAVGSQIVMNPITLMAIALI